MCMHPDMDAQVAETCHVGMHVCSALED